MKRAVVGIFAHVDAGKTTLCEAMLYECGELRNLGRVDHGNAFLDTHQIERERGITVFSKQAIMHYEDLEITLLDTPGHADFASEAERVIQAIDYAIVVINGPNGPQSHTETIWQLLARHSIPSFIFVNKMDLDGSDHQAIMKQLAQRLDSVCLDFTHSSHDELCEAASMTEECALEEFIETDTLSQETLRMLIAKRAIFPCYFGSALKLEGVKEFLQGISLLIEQIAWPDQFGARIFKITHDDQGNRLTWAKVTGGCIRVKEQLSGTLPDGSTWHEKVNQIRIYSGIKYACTDSATAGQICALTGLSNVYAGDCLGTESKGIPPLLEPVLAYNVTPVNADIHKTLNALQILSEEDPMLKASWDERLQEIRLQLMGSIQLEVISRILLERFGIEASFGDGGVLYKETILTPCKGYGHFEPLRHYAEVQLLLEPMEAGSGMSFGSVCSEDFLDRNWQRLIATHLVEKEHLGVLTGSPITDIRITILTGRTHAKHTNGGDFRQATYRAIRQGLMTAQSQLLEPWYSFKIEVPQEQVGRAMSDIQRMCGTFSAPQIELDQAIIKGFAPVSEIQGYARELNAYSHGKGRLTCIFDSYRPCHNSEEVIGRTNYDPEADLINTPDSVFCSHGAGYTVKWNEVPSFVHVKAEETPQTPWRKIDQSFFANES